MTIARKLLPEIDKNLIERIKREFLGIPPEQKDPIERIYDPIRQKHRAEQFTKNILYILKEIKEHDSELYSELESMARETKDYTGVMSVAAILYHTFATVLHNYIMSLVEDEAKKEELKQFFS